MPLPRSSTVQEPGQGSQPGIYPPYEQAAVQPAQAIPEQLPQDYYYADDKEKTQPTEIVKGDDKQKEEEEIEKVKHFRGPLDAKRSCTDIICLGLFLVALILFIVISLMGIINGNPLIMFMGFNSDGEMCGIGDYKDEMNVFSFDPIGCIAENPSSFMTTGCENRICVSKCPDENTTPWNWVQDSNETLSNLPYVAKFCKSNADESASVEENVKAGKCPPYLFPSTGEFFFRCEPLFLSQPEKYNETALLSYTFVDKNGARLPTYKALQFVNPLFQL